MSFDQLTRALRIERGAAHPTLARTRWSLRGGFLLCSLAASMIPTASGQQLNSLLFPPPVPVVMPNCMPSVPAGSVVPFTMSTHNSKGEVTYTKGILSPTTSGSGVLENDNSRMRQFSDRLNGGQNFDVNQKDVVYFRVWQEASGTYDMVLNNNYFHPQCDAATNMLRGAANNVTLVTVTFGTPYVAIPQ